MARLERKAPRFCHQFAARFTRMSKTYIVVCLRDGPQLLFHVRHLPSQSGDRRLFLLETFLQ